MTDYGRGSGSEPWDPEDPLFGDSYERGQGQGYPQQGGYDGYDTGSHDPYTTGSHHTGGYGGQDPYGGHAPQDPYATGQHQQGYYGQGGGYPQQGHPQQQPQQHQTGQYPQQGGQPIAGPGQGPQQGQGPGDQGTGQGQPGPDRSRTQAPAPGGTPARTAPVPAGGDWGADDEGDPREHAFFAGRDDDDDDRAPVASESSGRRAGRTQQAPRKRRSGCACLVVAAVLVGGLGGGVYYGYGVYQDHFGPAPDYSGQGAGTVQVVVPKGATLTVMGNLLKDAGVVKSVEAFTTAANKNPKGQSIQAGVYVLNRQMSAAAAVAMMLDPKSQDGMIISEGMRDKQIYAAVDTKLGLKAGTTEGVARAKYKTLGLPDWAVSGHDVKDPLEGFLFPSRYSVAKGMKPEDVLKTMVGQANEEFAKFDLVAEAKKQHLDGPYQLLTVASLVQAEGKTDDDFRKMAKVVYDRLLPDNKQGTNQLLQFDSTYNYVKNSSQEKISTKEIYSLKDPYNTYVNKGLPPGPIGNPGDAALKAAMNPDPGSWYFFISKDGKTTEFAETLTEFNKIKNG